MAVSSTTMNCDATCTVSAGQRRFVVPAVSWVINVDPTQSPLPPQA